MVRYTFFLAIVLVALAALSVRDKRQPSLIDYQNELLQAQSHRFNQNQMKSFVYYWYSLHDRHANVNQSLELLDKNNLRMTFPEMTVQSVADYKKWYGDVGKKIKSNLHQVKQLTITYLPHHQYRVNLIVNWRAIDKNGNLIDFNATQQWILVDGKSEAHPYIQKYDVEKFTKVK